MKTKLRTMLLAAAGVLGSAAVAHAQPAPAPAPPPPPAVAPPAVAPAAGSPAALAPGAVAQPVPGAPVVATQPAPIADPAPPAAPVAQPAGVAPAAMPDAPPPVAAAPVNWGGAPPVADPVKPEEVKKKPNPWGFSRLTWSNSGSAKIFGVGADYIGTEDETFTMDFGLNIRYSFLSEPKDKAYVNLAGGVEVELTNSDTTTTRHEPVLRDTSIGVGYSRVLAESADHETKTNWIISGGVSLPTSKISRDTGKYAGTSITTGLVHAQKLAGSKSDWFPDVLLFGTINWGHGFTRGTTATNDSPEILQRARRTAPPAGCGGGSECRENSYIQLSGYGLTHDRLKLNATYYLSIYKDVVSIGNSWEIEQKYKYKPAVVDCIKTTTGCTPIQPGLTPTDRNVSTTFDISVSYAIPQNLGRVDLGYVNTTGNLKDDGTLRSVFYSPDAQFYLNLVAYFDGIYDKAAAKPDVNSKQRVGALPRFNAR